MHIYIYIYIYIYISVEKPLGLRGGRFLAAVIVEAVGERGRAFVEDPNDDDDEALVANDR